VTNVTLFSDLHLEFEKPPECFHPGEGDVLVLPGDICTAKYINKEDSPYGKIFRNFFAECSKNYNKVFYVMGNHEHYGGNLTYTAERLRECLNNFANISLLDRDVEVYNGWNFVGATLWTDFANNNPNAMLLAEQGMNDYKTIRIGVSYQKLFAKNILREFQVTLNWIEDTFETLGGPTFMITHHQPSFQSINARYRGSPYNSLYASELSGLIARYPQIKYWAAGHTHSSVDYVTDQCRVIGNPRGYPPSFGGNNADFNPNFTIEL
jgi:predicted phosphodiesterase